MVKKVPLEQICWLNKIVFWSKIEKPKIQVLDYRQLFLQNLLLERMPLVSMCAVFRVFVVSTAFSLKVIFDERSVAQQFGGKFKSRLASG